MPFPFGKPIAAMIAVAAVSGLAIGLRPARPAADLTVWTFTTADATADRAVAGPRTRIDLVASAALDVRLSSLFMADLRPTADAGRPDVVELEIGSVGKFLRGPPDDVGFLPLDDYLRRSGWHDRILPSRLATYTHAGHVFGVPLDVHPVALVYRRDLLDLSQARTWPQLQQQCLRYQQSHADRAAMALPTTSPDVLLVMLQQRHVDLVDANLTPHLTDPLVVATICWYARAAAGPDRIGTDVNPAPGGAAADLAAGDVAALVLADWAVTDLERSFPALAGQLAMVPLPRFDPADAPTASWGGTMVGIPRFCPHPDRAWAWIEQAYFTRATERFSTTGVLPALPAEWASPALASQPHVPLYATLAADLPARHVTPYTTTAQNLLAWALNRTIARVRQGDVDLESHCATALSDGQVQLQRAIDFDRATGRAN